MNPSYLGLGRAIAGLCPSGFREARLDAAYEGEVARIGIVATLPDGTRFEPALRGAAEATLRTALGDVRKQMARESGAAWRTCTVTLVHGGGFAIDVGD
jgi:hypothetical protein